jgi:hypothetical protein
LSTLRIDNFGPSAGGTTYSARGIAKAWVNFNGTGTIAARDSENVSSLTDNATGDYTVNITNSMANTSYAACVNGKQLDDNDFEAQGLLTAARPVNSSSYRQYCRQSQIETGSSRDFALVASSTHGDLA